MPPFKLSSAPIMFSQIITAALEPQGYGLGPKGPRSSACQQYEPDSVIAMGVPEEAPKVVPMKEGDVKYWSSHVTNAGKTTLAKHFLKGEYFDLQRPSDQQVFADDIEFVLRRFETPLILDEAQTLPELFPVLRSIIDLDRKHAGRYYLLGSVNPALVKHISESLAGRVGIVELTPFLFSEITDLKIDLPDFWLKGGFPDALKEKEGSKWQRWQENYLRTFIERDIPRYGVKMSPIQISVVHGEKLLISKL